MTILTIVVGFGGATTNINGGAIKGLSCFIVRHNTSYICHSASYTIIYKPYFYCVPTVGGQVYGGTFV